MRCAVLGLFLAAAGVAQVPDGHYVVSSLWTQNSGLGGLHLVHPRSSGPATPVSGLAFELTGPGTSAYGGANCVAVDPVEGWVLVGEAQFAGETIYLHEIFLNGANAVFDRTTAVGVVASSTLAGGGIHQLALLPGGDVVFCVGGLSNRAPLFGHALGRLDRSSGIVSPIVVPAFVGEWANALAVDSTGTTIYVGLNGVAGGIYSVPVGGGASSLVCQYGSTSGLAIASDGRLFATMLDSVTVVDPANGTWSTRATLARYINGLTIEAATDAPVAVLNGLSSSPGVYWVDGATPRLLATNIPGIGSGVAVLDSPRHYGASTPGNVSYELAVAPAVGGLPLAGSPSFGLRVDAFGGAGSNGWLVLGLQPTDQPLLGMHLLVAPATAVSVGWLAPGTVVPLPIPVGLSPVRIHAQSFHFDPGAPTGIAATPGMLIGTIR